MQVCGTEIAPSQVRKLKDGREEAGFWLSLPPKGGSAAGKQPSSRGNRAALSAMPLKLPMLAAFRFCRDNRSGTVKEGRNVDR